MSSQAVVVTGALPADPGKTVQVLAFHPIFRDNILWVHNMLEKDSKTIPYYNGRPKPPGWGNGGGGKEPNEIELLRQRMPEHPLLANDTLSDEDKAIIACAMRELSDESGYYDIHINIPEGGDFRLLTYAHPDGHQIITVEGQVRSLALRPIAECNEIDMVEWFDLTMSLTEQFYKRGLPCRPYYSHVRRTLIGVQQIDYRLRDEIGGTYHLRGDRLHPSWRLIWPLGRGDARFPANGFRMSYLQWYDLFEKMVKDKQEMVNLDYVYEFFTEAIQKAKEHEELARLRAEYLAGKMQISEVSPDMQVQPESPPESSDAEYDDAEVNSMILEEEDRIHEQYRQWLDSEWEKWAKREYGI